MLQKLSRDDVKLHISTYAVFVLCQTLGDSGSYHRFIQRQRDDGDLDAINMLNSIKAIESIHAAIEEFTALLDCFGKGRVSLLMREICSCTVCKFSEAKMWNICNITGNCIPHSIVVKNMHVDVAYKPFVHALWVIVNAKSFVTCIIDSFLENAEHNLKRGAIIVKFKQEITEEAYSVFCESYEYVFQSLNLTLAALNNIPSTQPSHPTCIETRCLQ